MFIHRPARLAVACRRRAYFPLSVACSLVGFLAFAPSSAWADVTGQVVDSSARPVPRAYVRVVDSNGATVAGVFTDERGTFAVPYSSPCTIEISLTGFQTATRPCQSDGQPIRLTVAPVRETVMVTATRTDAPAGQVGASATVFTAEDLERAQKPLLADLLVSTPGAMLMRSGGPGSVTSLFVRGGESDYNKILLDGVPLNEPGGTFYLNNLTTENLDRIEIVRGAYSSLFGSDAMASVIQLFTKRGTGETQRPHVTGQFDGGTYGTTHASAGVSGAVKRVDYGFGAAHLDSDNRVPNSGLENTTVSSNVGLAVNDRTTLRFIGRAELEHVGTPGPTAFGRPDLDAFFQRHDGVASIAFDQQLTSAVRQRASYSLTLSNQDSTNLIADPSYRAMYQGQTAVFVSSDFLNDTRNELRRHHLSYQSDMRIAADERRGTHTLTLLADWDGERAASINRLAITRTDNERNNFGVSAQDQMLWRRLFVTVGGRVEQNDSFGTAFVPRATAVFVVHQSAGAFGETHINASAGTGIKEPTMLESFSLSPFAKGNPDLQPERSRSAEVGIEQRLANDRARITLAYFHNRFSDVISVRTTNPATFEGQYDNVGVTRARGIELNAEAVPMPALRVRGSYTFLDGKVLETLTPNDPVFGLGHELFRRPRHSGSVGVTVGWDRVSADLNGVFLGHFVDSDFGLFSPPFQQSPGHTTWDARVTVKVTHQLSGMLMIDNLTNADYSEPLGYQPLLRTVRAGVRVAF